MNLKELAALLNLSTTTVSRALGGYADVSDATRKRVEAAAQANHYRPSHHASRLAGGSSMTIGHVISANDNEHTMINPHFSDFIMGASEVYAEKGYDMLITQVRPSHELSSKEVEAQMYRELHRSRKVDGVVLHDPVVKDFRIPLLQSLNFPFVVHGRSDAEQSTYNLVDVNNRRAFLRGTDFLLDLGHKRIALINGIGDMNFAYRRRIGYENALTSRGIYVDKALIFESEMIEPFGYEVTKKLLKGDNPPSAFMVSSILPALGALRAIQECGLTMGDDISVIVFDDKLSFLENKGEFPLFTSLRSSLKEAGKLVAELMIEQIKNPEQPPKQHIYDAELLIGQSTKRYDPNRTPTRTGNP